MRPEECIEFDIVVGPPAPLSSPGARGDSHMFFWIERDGFVHFADSMSQAEWDRREYILEVLSD